MRSEEIAYLAGLFDGEGDVGRYMYKATKNGKRYPKLTARIHNTDKNVLVWAKNVLGYGLVYRDRKGIKKSGNPGRKQAYVFIVTHKKARDFLPLVLPYLKIKGNKVVKILKEDNLYVNRTRLPG